MQQIQLSFKSKNYLIINELHNQIEIYDLRLLTITIIFKII